MSTIWSDVIANILKTNQPIITSCFHHQSVNQSINQSSPHVRGLQHLISGFFIALLLRGVVQPVEEDCGQDHDEEDDD